MKIHDHILWGERKGIVVIDGVMRVILSGYYIYRSTRIAHIASPACVENVLVLRSAIMLHILILTESHLNGLIHALAAQYSPEYNREDPGGMPHNRQPVPLSTCASGNEMDHYQQWQLLPSQKLQTEEYIIELLLCINISEEIIIYLMFNIS